MRDIFCSSASVLSLFLTTTTEYGLNVHASDTAEAHNQV